MIRTAPRPSPLARDEGFRAGHEYSSKNGPRSGPAPGLGDVRASDRVGGAGLGDGVLEVDVDAVLVELGDDLLGGRRALLAGRRRAGSSRVDPVSRRYGGPPSTCARTTSRWRGRTRFEFAAVSIARARGDAVVVGEDMTVTRLMGGANDIGGSSWPSDTVECDCRSIMWRPFLPVRACQRRPRSDDEQGPMRISAKADYAVRATLELAASPDGARSRAQACRRAGDTLQFSNRSCST